MKTKYTKDEWKIEYPIVGDFIIHADGLRIASTHLIDDRLEEQEANAKLIAAAPKMLEACFNARHHLSTGFNDVASILKILTNAIDKATK